MCRGNRNNFYCTARLSGCLGYLFGKECYASLAVLLTQKNNVLCLVVADCCQCMRQGVQRPENSRNVREFRFKEKKLRKSQEIFKNTKSQGRVREFCCVKFISNLGIIIFKIFWRSMPPEPPKQSCTHIRS